MSLRLSALLSLIFLVTLGVTSSSGQTSASASDGWVVLPVNEYTALKRAASPAEPEPAAPPVEATLSRIDYTLKVDGDLATGEARLTVDVIKNGWVRIAMPDGLIVRDAQLDGRPVNLAMRTKDKGPGCADLLLSKTGRSIVTLKIVAPVTTVAGTDILHLPVSTSAISQQDLQLQASRPVRMGTTLDVGAVSEVVTVTSGVSKLEIDSRLIEDLVRSNQMAQMNMPSQNVANLQRRVAGILPVRIDVPRSGKSYRFVRPLVLDEETRITFQYKSR